MARIEFLIKGVSPLLVHSPQSMAGMNTPSVGKGKKVPSPEEQAEQSAYRNAEGQFVFPVIGPRNALLKAAKRYKVKGKRASLFEDVAHIQPEEDYAVILNGNGKPAKEYVVDTRRAVVQRNGVLRSRAKFEVWSLRFALIYDAELTNPEVLRQVLEDAGNRIGIGDYRPACWGWFGRFTVAEVA